MARSASPKASSSKKQHEQVRAIRPSTVEDLQYNLGIDRADLYFALAAHRAAIYRQGGVNGLVGDPTLAILIRYYMDQPDLATRLIPPTPHPTSIFSKLKKAGDGSLSKRRFALMLGRSPTFPTYAMREGSGGVAPGTPIARLLLAIENDCAAHGAEEAYNRLVRYVDEEVKTRGIDPMDEGSWCRRKILRKAAEEAGVVDGEATLRQVGVKAKKKGAKKA